MRLRSLSLALLVAIAVTAPVQAATAAVPADNNVKTGWIRVYPASATLATAIDTLTEAPCPAKTKAVIASVSGPGIPADPGLIVGNTQLKSFPLTSTGQVYVPMSMPLNMWFAQNAPGLKPKGTYSLTVTCRDKFYPTEYARFTGQLKISSGRYSALGEAAKPFDAEVFRDNGLGDPVDVGGQSSTGAPAASPSPATTAGPAATRAPSPTASATSPAPVGSAPAAARTPEASAAAGSASSPGSSSSSTVRLVLLIGAALLALGGAAWGWSRRQSAGPPGSHSA